LRPNGAVSRELFVACEGRMADILEFRSGAKGSGKKERGDGPAEVVIFPGVRIEREQFSLADRISTPQRETGATRRRRAQSDD